ncbi:RNA polymerase sigma factor [Cellulophaga tyrosinoxydans]|uniref:RNA polymerase sigma factor n=1 Tax=Cellulophaga tyrosinoxydans TaxID=504486 RepID=A0A1W2BZF2_9FLAO|nr:RNA polymerase sigma factor [Cellulophaga tyrosinoxydans]SMC78309.1 RNA polymerase sigma-70 factor, ECF subfamily [Cellulophaga tyrosinoxydans]
MSQNQDLFYIKATINGDTHAFSVLIDRYKHMVFTLAIKMLKNRENAEEVAQDTFVKAYSSLSTFKGDAKFSTWLYKIAYYGCLDYLKKDNRRMETSSIDSDHDINASDYITVLEQFERQDRENIIKQSIDELSPEEAFLVTLHYFEELSLQEISEVINVSPNVIKVRLFRTRKRLAEIIETKLSPETIKSYGRK